MWEGCLRGRESITERRIVRVECEREGGVCGQRSMRKKVYEGRGNVMEGKYEGKRARVYEPVMRCDQLIIA